MRFGNDYRLRDAYSLLTSEFLEDEYWHNIIWASSCAVVDFQRYRNELSFAARACSIIGDVADYLSFLLDELDQCGVSTPELQSVQLLINRDGDIVLSPANWTIQCEKIGI